MNVLTHQMKMGDPLNKEIIPKRLSKEIWEFAFSKEIMITAEYLPDRLDIRADWASKIAKTQAIGYCLQEYSKTFG